MSYWRLPERLYDDVAELAQWVQASLAVAKCATAAKRKRARGTAKPAKLTRKKGSKG